MPTAEQVREALEEEGLLHSGCDSCAETAARIAARLSPPTAEGPGVNCPDCGGRIATACPHCGAEPCNIADFPSPPTAEVGGLVERLETPQSWYRTHHDSTADGPAFFTLDNTPHEAAAMLTHLSAASCGDTANRKSMEHDLPDYNDEISDEQMEAIRKMAKPPPLDGGLVGGGVVAREEVTQGQLALANWTKYNDDQADEVVYQAEKLATALRATISALTAIDLPGRLAAERERCAKVADNHRAKRQNAGGFENFATAALIVAAAIRGLGRGEGEMDCLHNNQDETTGGRRYCLDCGQRMLTEPSYYRVHEKTRTAQWREVFSGSPVEPHKIYIGAQFNEETRVWMLGRVFWCDDCAQFECVQEGLGINHRDHSAAGITHYAPDLLGAPYDALRRHGLPSALR